MTRRITRRRDEAILSSRKQNGDPTFSGDGRSAERKQEWTCIFMRETRRETDLGFHHFDLR